MRQLTCLAALIFATVAVRAQPAFEVASVKQLATFEPGLASEKIIAHPGTLTMRSARLRAMIKWAYDVKDYQITGPAWLGNPGWMGGEIARYEVQAKAPEGTPIPEMKRMLQRLLAERFKLVLHRESKDITAFVLTFAGPAPGPSLASSADQDTSGTIGGSPNGALSFHHMTLTEFADFMSGPVRTPILDRSGVTGRFDFTLAPQGPQPESMDALPDIMRSQLGIEMKRQKTPIEYLIVDSADQKPLEN